MAAAPALTKHDLERNLIQKCWKDADFRSEVLKDPKGMLEAFLGKTLPADFHVVIHEEDSNTLHFAIPPAPPNRDELSDEDLERIAGGTELAIAFLVAATVTAVTGAGGATKPYGGW